MVKQYRGGAYSFRDSVVAARVDSVAGTEATIRVKSAYWPVVMTVDGEEITQTFTDETPVAVDFLAAGSYNCSFTEQAVTENPRNDSDTLTVVIPS